jgi:hypothetical protein
MIFIADVFSKAWYVELVPALLSLLEHISKMRLYEELGGLDFSEVHVEWEFIDHMIVSGWRPREYIWLI